MSRMSRLGFTIVGLAFAGAALAPTVLSAAPPQQQWGGGASQGWTAADRAGWYNADQGSRLIPLAWFQALEQPSGAAGQLFLNSDYLAGFRILPPVPGAPAALPIGFAVDKSNDSGYVKTQLSWAAGQNHNAPWVGLNCAACHTGELTYHNQPMVIEGAPNLFDYQSFVQALDLALTQTRDSAAPGANNGRWNRFAAIVLRGHDDAGNRGLLLTALNKLIAWETQAATLNQTDLHYGFGRVDAVGHILNRILLFGGARQPFPNASDAPVSYPQLWNTNLETHVEWDGIAQNADVRVAGHNFDYGALGRNTGEVLGVFGEAVIKPRKNKYDYSGFVSSVQVGNLNLLELQVARLRPPAWPSKLFGTPGDIGLKNGTGQKLTPAQVVADGHSLFDANCASCHTPGKTYETMHTFQEMSKGGNLTDIWMACNTWDDRGNSGALMGIQADYVSGAQLQANEPSNALLVATVKGVLIGKKYDAIKTALQTFFGITPPPLPVPTAAVTGNAKQRRMQRCLLNDSNPLLAYKARPLEGIWATAPYLHNGSVPTLYDLLLPMSARPRTFLLGTRVFDPAKVGYDTSAGAPGNGFTFDTTLAGNSNNGHVYGVDKLTEAERLELVEYLKTL